MSRLSVYWPEEIYQQQDKTDEPRILPFTARQRDLSTTGTPMDVVTRARVLFSNRACRECGYPVVEPLELPDSTLNLSGLAIPGTSTLVGFRCCGCDHEWSVD